MPLCAGLLCASTLAFSKNYGWIDLSPKKAVIPAVPDVANMPKIKTLKTTKNGVMTYGDSIVTAGKTYRAETLTAEDEAYLLKTQNLKVEVVEIKRKPGEVWAIFPPSTAIRSAGEHSAVVIAYTKKGYEYKESTFIANNHINFLTVIYLKNGDTRYFIKSSASAADIKLLAEKYGYTFPGNGKYELAKPGQPLVKFPPPVVKPDAPVAVQNQVKPPPPPPFESVYKDFFIYLQKVLIYPKDARKNKLTGSVVAHFKLDASHYITAVKIISSSDSRFETGIIDAINSYKGAINKPAGEYNVGFDFNLAGLSNPDEIRAKEAKMMAMPNFTGLISIVAFPPPPAAPKAVKRLPPPVVKPDTSANLFEPFYIRFSNMVKYPAEDIAQKIQGMVLVTFTITSDKKIQHIAVIRAPDDLLTDAVSNTLQACSIPGNAEPGTYVMPVYFRLLKPDGSKVEGGSKPVKSNNKSIMKSYPVFTQDHNVKSLGLDEVVITGYTAS